MSFVAVVAVGSGGGGVCVCEHVHVCGLIQRTVNILLNCCCPAERLGAERL